MGTNFDLQVNNTQGEGLEDAIESAGEAVALYVEGLREDDEPLTGVTRRMFGVAS